MIPDKKLTSDLKMLLAKSRLTQREKEIALLISENRNNGEICAQLVISESTLKSHINNIYRKLPRLKTFRDQLRG